MKKLVAVLLTAVLAIQCMTPILTVWAASGDTEALQARIDALPDAAELSPGQEPYRTELLNIFRELYALALTSADPPHLQKLYDAADVVLTLNERCWAIVPTGEPENSDTNYDGISASRIRD